MFRRDIEGLRALAVGFVILFHAKFLGLTGGFIGVDVFFVVSGFLITSLLINEHSSVGEISLKNFYARRARRLLPASALVIAVTALASRIWLEPLRLKDIGADAVASGGFFSNILFGVRSTDYLQAGQPPSPFQHFWSLSVEEQFYIVWPALLILLLWKSRDRHTRAIVAIATLSIVSLSLCIWQTTQSQPWAFFGLHTRAWELGIGALVALCWKYVEQLPTNFRAVIGWLGLFAIVISGLTITEKMAFPGKLALLPVVATALVLMAGQHTHWGPQRLLSIKPLQWIGARSYSIYLWHWPVLIIAESHTERALSITERLIAIAGAVIAASLSHHFLENPVRHSVSLQAKPRLALTVGGALIISSLGVGLVLRNSSVALSTDVVAEAPVAIVATTSTVVSSESTTAPLETTTSLVTIPEGPPPPIVNPVAPIDAVIAGALTDEVPANLQPSLRGASGDKPEIYDNGCHVNLIAIEPKVCVYGDTTSDFTVALYGDSHAAQWFPAFEKMAIKRNWKFISYTKRGCPPADIPTYSKVLGKNYKECAPWRENVLKQMVTDGVQTVFIAHFDRLLSASTRIPMWQKEWRAGLQSTIDSLTAKGITPILMEDTPYPGQDVPTCLSRHYTNVQLCNPIISSAYREDMHQMLQDFDAEDVHVLWTRPWFCTDAGCPTVVGNILVYRDDNHMTVTFASFIAPLLDAAVVDVVDWVSTQR